MPQPEGHLPQVVKKKEGHMPELRKRRPRLAVLGAFAMVASVLAVGASPASATPGRADGAAAYSACVGPAAADAGFTDVAAGSTHDAAINCIAYYGITRGTSATTFSPNRTISRWQLAVMLQRAAGLAGVDLPAAADQGFTDISNLSASFQAAINQMAGLEVMVGTTTTTFDPDGAVSRATIVEALAGFLTNARVGPGGLALTRNSDRTMTLRRGALPLDPIVPLDERFRDIGVTTYSANQSIRALAEMGVVSGRGDGTFGPAASVTRGQAASFITRALAHTNARPAGLTVQSNVAASTGAGDITLAVSMRGNDFSIREDVPVDVFLHRTENRSGAFKADGTCQTSGRLRVQDAIALGAACVIEIDDNVTNPAGNVEIEVDAPSSPTTYWAWTGAVGDKLDWNKANLSMDNTVVSDAASVSVSNVSVPTSAMVTTSVSSDADGSNTVRYGDTVTVTIQLMNLAGEPVSIPGKTYQWWAEGVNSPGSDRRPIPGTGTSTVTTGADGRATFTLTETDPDTDDDVDGPGEDGGANDRTTWTYYIAATGTSFNRPVNPASNAKIGFAVTGSRGSGTLVFDDDPGVAKKLSIDLARRWTPRPTAGATGRVGVTAKVTDQYGTPMPRHPVYFDLVNNTNSTTDFGCSARNASSPYDCIGGDTSIDPNTGEVGGTVRRLTRSNGTSTLTAVYRATGTPGTVKSGAEATDNFARYTVGTDLDGSETLAGTDELKSALHFWAADPAGWNADAGTATATPMAVGLRHIDMANNVLIGDGPIAYRYNSDTIFKFYIERPATGSPPMNPPPTDANTRWIGEAELERRMRAHMAHADIVPMLVDPSNTNPLRTKMKVRQFNILGRPSATGTSFSVIEVYHWTTYDIGDPPQPGG